MDFLPTKGTEYLLVIGYLLLLVPFARALLLRPAAATVPVSGTTGAGAWRRVEAGTWFPLPEGLHFHPGHTWAAPEGGGVFRLGMDGFALRMLGRPEALHLPRPGTELEPGETGWHLSVGGHDLSLLSPVAGEVVEVNPAAVESPGRLGDDPYGEGWLLKVKTKRTGVLKNLLSGKLARAWMEEAFTRVSRQLLPQLGMVLQDGGEPVEGFARELDPEHWPAIAAEMLLTAEPDETGSRPTPA